MACWMVYEVANQENTIKFFNNDETDADLLVDYQEKLCASLPDDGYMQVFSIPMVGVDKDQVELIYSGVMARATAIQIKTVREALRGNIQEEALTNGEIFNV